MGQRRSIQGARILITGASQGIGRALAVAAACRGGKVLAAARSTDLLHALADEIKANGGTLETVAAERVHRVNQGFWIGEASHHPVGAREQLVQEPDASETAEDGCIDAGAQTGDGRSRCLVRRSALPLVGRKDHRLDE